MDLNLTGKNAIVCGSTQGIGWASAQALADLGANITLIARNEDKLKNKCSSLNSTGDHNYVSADFSDIENLKTKLEELCSTKSFHILINNTGGPPGGLGIDANIEEYLKAFKQHLICNQLLAQAVVPGMKKDGYGRIINIISTSVKAPLKGLGVSNTIRGAVGNWAKTLANELGVFNITVNNVLPGATETERLQSIIESKANKTGKSIQEISDQMKSAVPMARFAQPGEIANAVAFLASPAASYINGINIPVDGGRTPNL